MNFENIMGGGQMEEFINGILSSHGPQLIQSVTANFLSQAEEALKKLINDHLHGEPAM